MSHHSEEALFVPGTDSFWEPGNYKRTVKRTEDGFKLCNDLIQLISERAEIEKVYAKNLKTWSKKWLEFIEKGPEYGTAEAAWKAVLEEADRRSEIHVSVKDKLLNDVVASIKQWQKDSYHKSMMHIKEKKEFEDNFKKAQKPWAKLLDKTTRAKQDYHQACKNERSAINQERNASGDTSLSPDQVKKLQERVVKCKEEVQKTREKYEGSLRELTEYNPKYQDDMSEVFEKCQEFEEKRLVFFRDTFFSLHNSLNIAADAELARIYVDFKQVIDNADARKDLKWWSQNHGVDMPANWPTFEEYTPDLHNISKKERKIVSQMINHDSVTLTNHVRHDLSCIPAPPTPACHLATTHHASGFHNPPPHVQIHAINNHSHHLTYNNYSNNKSNGKTATTTSSSSTSSSSGGSANNSLDPSCVSKKHSSTTASNNHHNNHHHGATKYAGHQHHLSTNGSSDHVEVASSAAASSNISKVNSINTTAAAAASSTSTANNTTTVAMINNSTSEKNCESTPHHTNCMVDSTPFDDDHEYWDDDTKDALVDNGEPGTPVRALYDYDGAEADELSFKQGDEFEKLEDEDEQGWCKGRKDGRVGLYPANYVEPIPLPLPVK